MRLLHQLLTLVTRHRRQRDVECDRQPEPALADRADADPGATLRTSIVAAGVTAGEKSTLLNVGLNFMF